MTDQNKTHGVLTDAEIQGFGVQTGCFVNSDPIKHWYGKSYGADHIAFARAIEAAVLAKAAPQSPVAPADERAILELITERDLREDIIDQLCDAVLGRDRTEWSSAYDFADAVRDVEEHMLAIERARLADAPNTCVCGHSSILGVVHRTDGPCFVYATGEAPTVSATVPSSPLSVFATGKWTYSETGQAFSAAQMDEAAFVTYRDHLAAPTPPTSAADAVESSRARMERGEAILAIVRAAQVDGKDVWTPGEYVAAGWRAAIAPSRESGDE